VTPSHRDPRNDTGSGDAELKERANAYFAGEMSPDEQTAFERMMVENPEIAQAVYTEMGMGPVFHEALQALRIRHLESHARLADGSVSKRVPWWGQARSRFVVTVAAAAVVFLVVLVSNLGEEPTDQLSSEQFGADPTGFRGVAPTGFIDPLPAQFSWTPHPTATHYRLEIYDNSSQLVYSTLTNETMLIVAVDRLAEKGFHAGDWLVVPLDTHGVELGTTAPVGITVSAP
jgi:hypothetical protein